MTEERTIICACGSFEHQVTFYIISERIEDDWDELYMAVHLTTYRNIFKRMWYAIKYVFGYKSKFGAWDEMIFSDKEKEKLYQYLKENLSNNQ